MDRPPSFAGFFVDMAMTDETTPTPPEAPAPRALTPQAQRALAEAAERRARAQAEQTEAPKELGGRGGLEPARYGDWEIKGIACDF